MPLSKVLEWMMELTASLISAVSSMMTGVLPAPTPSAGLPEEYAALHHAGAAGGEDDIRLVHHVRSSAPDSGHSMQPMMPSGAPALTAAS